WCLGTIFDIIYFYCYQSAITIHHHPFSFLDRQGPLRTSFPQSTRMHLCLSLPEITDNIFGHLSHPLDPEIYYTRGDVRVNIEENLVVDRLARQALARLAMTCHAF